MALPESGQTTRNTMVVLIIIGGLALSVPAKLYLTLQLMRHADEKAARQLGE